jgi:hypothetical protein
MSHESIMAHVVDLPPGVRVLAADEETALEMAGGD